jgi:two-component system sensor histidine kinase/response regulator
MSTCIFVVEDEAPLREGLKELLQGYGYEVVTTANGQEALDALAQSRPDLILADIMMPVMDGYALYEAVRANPAWDAIPFIFLTALGDKTDIRLGRELGVDDYVVKPFEPEEVLASIRGRLRRVEAYQAEAESRLEGLKKQIITMLGHELNTPLTYIMGFAELAMEDLAVMEASELEVLLSGVLRGAERLQRRIRDSLTLLQLDSGLLAREFERFASPNLNLSTVIQGTVAAFGRQAAEKGVRLESLVPPVLPPVMTQTNYFSDILSRLLDNAIKFTPPSEGEVTVSAGVEDDLVWLKVADNGVGIAPDDIPRLFRPLEQIDRKVLEQQGTGLGLAIVRGMVDLHGGKIQIESQPGQGSAFTIWLPQAEPA